MEFLAEYGMFLAKVVTFVLAIIIVLAFAVANAHRGGSKDKGKVNVAKLNERFEHMADSVKEIAWSEKELKEEAKQRKKEHKEKQKSEKNKEAERRKRVYVVDFDGDVKASATDELREAITAVLTLAEPQDEVVVRLESPGGVVHGYGLAASQLARIKSKKIPLTVCVDKVAASGGYMMACVADKILAAPFAIIGSIGVVAQLPNFNKLLKKHDVDFDVYTAGEYKRTLTIFGENTDKGKQKFIEELEDTHVLFKEFIHQHREKVDIEQVSTGEYWFATRAMEKSLVDEISTSDEYLLSHSADADILHVEYEFKKSIQDRLGIAVSTALEATFTKLFTRINNRFWSM